MVITTVTFVISVRLLLFLVRFESVDMDLDGLPFSSMEDAVVMVSVCVVVGNVTVVGCGEDENDNDDNNEST